MILIFPYAPELLTSHHILTKVSPFWRQTTYMICYIIGVQMVQDVFLSITKVWNEQRFSMSSYFFINYDCWKKDGTQLWILVHLYNPVTKRTLHLNLTWYPYICDNAIQIGIFMSLIQQNPSKLFSCNKSLEINSAVRSYINLQYSKKVPNLIKLRIKKSANN